MHTTEIIDYLKENTSYTQYEIAKTLEHAQRFGWAWVSDPHKYSFEVEYHSDYDGYAVR